MQKILQKIEENKILNQQDVDEFLNKILSETIDKTQAVDILKAISKRGETADEIVYFTKFLKNTSKKVPLSSEKGLLDVCGTGGDCLSTFNISTAVAFVAAGAGANVIKHGNRSVSSKSGSADVLESLGINIQIPAEKLQQTLDESGMVFLFAPFFNSGMAKIKEIRKSINAPTIFNLLGPLLNPIDLDFQIIGVYDFKKCEAVANALLTLGVKEAMVIHGHNGLDELSTTGENLIFHIKNGQINKTIINPQDLGLKPAKIDDLFGENPQKNAKIILDILKGEMGYKREVVLLNAAAALVVSGLAENFEQGIKKAAQSIDSGRAMEVLERLKNVSR